MRTNVYLVLCFCLTALPGLTRSRADGTYIATAYSTPGVTASGEYTHERVAAADPGVIPLGSIIRISGAGRYSGEYVVADTGPKIQGRKLDLFIPSTAAARQFGKRRVRVEILELSTSARK